MRRKKQEQDAPASGDRRVTPADVQQVEFRLAFRGYSERDVDAFLDKVTEDMSAYLEENQRLRAGAGLAATDADTGDAEQILARAREEAAAIVRRAEEDSAAIRAAAGAATGVPGDTRAAVAPFLNREREFLQSLGSLVQGHAEEIKQMVVTLRGRAESAPASPAAEEPAQTAEPDRTPEEPPAPAAEDRPSPFPPEQERSDEVMSPASASEIADRLGLTESTSSSQDRPDEVGTVVIESSTEPAYSSEGAPAGERRERSLRELFWGED